MNLMFYVKNCLYIFTHLWAIDKIDEMYYGGIRIWFALADGGMTGIPTNWFTFAVIVLFACIATTAVLTVSVNVIWNLITLCVEKYKARKKSDGTLV